MTFSKQLAAALRTKSQREFDVKLAAIRKQFVVSKSEQQKADHDRQLDRTARLMAGKRLPVTL